MDIFGDHWHNHAERIRTNCLRVVGPDDLILIPGDISWAMRRAEAEIDLNWVAQLPGTKILCKGNHDYWWDSDRPLKHDGLSDTPYISRNGIIGVAGTRGWTGAPESTSNEDHATHERMVRRETQRLTKRLIAIENCPRKFVMVHYPPIAEFLPLLQNFGITTILYGHLHLNKSRATLNEDWLGIRAICVAADRLSFAPRLIDTIVEEI